MNNSPSIKSLAYPYGIGLAVYSIIVLVLLYLFNISEQNWWLGLINITISIIVYYYALSAFKKQNRGYVTLSQCLKLGLAIAAVAGVIGAIYSFVHYSYVYPEFADFAYEQQKTAMLENGQMTEEQIEQSMEMTSFTRTPVFITTASLIMSLFFGFIISLILGLIIKKKDPALE